MARRTKPVEQGGEGADVGNIGRRSIGRRGGRRGRVRPGHDDAGPRGFAGRHRKDGRCRSVLGALGGAPLVRVGLELEGEVEFARFRVRQRAGSAHDAGCGQDGDHALRALLLEMGRESGRRIGRERPGVTDRRAAILRRGDQDAARSPRHMDDGEGAGIDLVSDSSAHEGLPAGEGWGKGAGGVGRGVTARGIPGSARGWKNDRRRR